MLERKLKRTPTVKEIRKASKKTTPPADQIEKSVRAIIEYFLLEDARAVAASACAPAANSPDGAAETSPQPKLFFKGQNKVRDLLQRQLRHVTCLCDPPSLNMYRATLAGAEHCCRGSSKNEILNKMFNREVLPYGIVSVQRADRCCWTLVDEWNAKANIKKARSRGLSHNQHGITCSCQFFVTPVGASFGIS